jgi:hypothetical protein
MALGYFKILIFSCVLLLALIMARRHVKNNPGFKHGHILNSTEFCIITYLYVIIISLPILTYRFDSYDKYLNSITELFFTPTFFILYVLDDFARNGVEFVRYMLYFSLADVFIVLLMCLQWTLPFLLWIHLRYKVWKNSEIRLFYTCFYHSVILFAIIIIPNIGRIIAFENY